MAWRRISFNRLPSAFGNTTCPKHALDRFLGHGNSPKVREHDMRLAPEVKPSIRPADRPCEPGPCGPGRTAAAIGDMWRRGPGLAGRWTRLVDLVDGAEVRPQPAGHRGHGGGSQRAGLLTHVRLQHLDFQRVGQDLPPQPAAAAAAYHDHLVSHLAQGRRASSINRAFSAIPSKAARIKSACVWPKSKPRNAPRMCGLGSSDEPPARLGLNNSFRAPAATARPFPSSRRTRRGLRPPPGPSDSPQLVAHPAKRGAGREHADRGGEHAGNHVREHVRLRRVVQQGAAR